MRRRNKTDINLDSLLDTLTNVIGFLIIVLVVLQLNVKQGIKSIQRPSIMAAIEENSDEAKAVLSRIPLISAQVDQIEVENDSLRSLLSEEDRVDIQAVYAEIEELEEDIYIDEQAISRIRDKIRALNRSGEESRVEELPHVLIKQSYDSTSNRGAVPEWKRKNRVIYVCNGGRVFKYDPETIWQSLTSVLARLVVLEEGGDISKEDMRKVSEYLDRHDVGDQYFKFTYDLSEDRLQLIFRPSSTRKNNASEQVTAFKSELNRRFKPQSDWILFYVWDDSFKVYLSSRRVAEDRGFQVGWMPLAADQVIYDSAYLGGGSSEHGPDL